MQTLSLRGGSLPIAEPIKSSHNCVPVDIILSMHETERVSRPPLLQHLPVQRLQNQACRVRAHPDIDSNSSGPTSSCHSEPECRHM
jgi:hypothetical protein